MRLSRHDWLILLVLTALMIPLRMLLAQGDGRLSGPQIMDLLEPPLIQLVPAALFSLAARQFLWVSQWSDLASRLVIVGGQCLVAGTIYAFRQSLDAGTVSTLITAVTGILSGLTLPAQSAGVSAMASRAR